MPRFRHHLPVIFLPVVLIALTVIAAAFDGQKQTVGPLTITIGDIGLVDTLDKPYDTPVVLENASDAPLTVELLAATIDTCRIVGPAEQKVTVPAKGMQTATIQIAAGPGTYNAHYPIHIAASFGPSASEARVVQVFETKFEAATAESPDTTTLPLNVVPPRGGVLLTRLMTHRVAWGYYDQPLQRLPVAWQGSDETSRASFSRTSSVARGDSKAALSSHPPYRGGGGAVIAEYTLQLPNTTPITFSFANAIRDNAPQEPSSDGVTFRVWAQELNGDSDELLLPGHAEHPAAKLLFEKHTDAKVWTPGEVDLDAFAGKTIVLGLESHPGPKRNTVCDSCYWGEPVVFAGEKPTRITEEQRRLNISLAEQGVSGINSPAANLRTIPLSDGGVAAIALGPNGLLDGAVGIGTPDKVVVFDGLDVAVEDSPVGQWPSTLVTERVDVQSDEGGVHVTHHLRLDNEAFPLTVHAFADGPGLRIKIDCPRNISSIMLGPATKLAPRVFFGHGYCVVEPEAVEINGGGHGLSTSHVAFEFADGPAVLLATDTPPDSLKIDPERKLYTLRVHPSATLTLVPSAKNAFDAAFRYRPLYDKQPAPGFTKKAGRFVYDNWGGKFVDDTAELREAFAYGATDAIVLKHVWQRWGYDNRLPDIYPPEPKQGGLEPLQEMAGVCRDAGVLFGLHDNYIDYYPDADGFTYDCIAFQENGQPRKAWINTSRDAQSYKWRADRFAPFLHRNLALMKSNIPLTSSFVDVFSAANVSDYYDHEGSFHSRTETQRLWGECFTTIRDTLGDNAPTVSEAGDDFLIGWLDGADCQFLQLSAEPGQYHIRLPCKDWIRVPWFDAVNHARFSLHGVGYSGRYQGGRSRALHGIESDDYISAELLTGHALMTDRGALLRGGVRKYWLAQHIVSSLATDDIESVEFVDGDMRRQRVTWKSGTVVHVNRSDDDWAVQGHVLPKYGFWAKGPGGQSAIERKDGVVVERSWHGDTLYVNGRGSLPDGPLPITPRADSVEWLGDRRFKLLVDWEAKDPAPKDVKVFYHFFKPQVSRLHMDGWHGGGGTPDTPTSQWSGVVRTGENWAMQVPEDVPPGEYDVLVGLYDGGHRYALLGNQDGETRCRLGKLVIEGQGDEVTGVRLVKMPYVEPLADRLTPNKKPIDFGPVVTTGGMRIVASKIAWTVTPLPRELPCSVTLRLNGRTIASITAIDQRGETLRETPFKTVDGGVTFETRTEDFAYEVRFTE